MKQLVLFFVVFGMSSTAFATGASGKIEVCRHPVVVEQPDRSKVELAVPFTVRQGPSGQEIRIEDAITLGPKPSCKIVTGVATLDGEQAPKKGSIWQSGVTAKPGQYWGKKPQIQRIKMSNGQYGEVEVSDPSHGGTIQSVTVRARALEDFK